MSTLIDADKYYTPYDVACKALERAQLFKTPYVCGDTACGAGGLLVAAEKVLKAKYFFGFDKDIKVIRDLRESKPEWKLYSGDFLKRRRAPKLKFNNACSEVDLLLLNPPFSFGSKKFITVNYKGHSVNCSVAMGHILHSLEIFKPKQGAIAVVPESLLYSEIDQRARDLLGINFSNNELLNLSIYTFKGARVNSSFIQLCPDLQAIKPSEKIGKQIFDIIDAKVVRGGLQMHSFERIQKGVRVVHSTSLKAIACDGITVVKERTNICVKGRISGWILLLPRVGVPNREALCVVYIKEEIQLSDCVIGIKFFSKNEAFIAKNRIIVNWNALIDLYRGTGARYITIDKLVRWFGNIGINNIEL